MLTIPCAVSYFFSLQNSATVVTTPDFHSPDGVSIVSELRLFTEFMDNYRPYRIIRMPKTIICYLLWTWNI